VFADVIKLIEQAKNNSAFLPVFIIIKSSQADFKPANFNNT